MATKKAKANGGISEAPMDFDHLSYRVDELARESVLKHPSVLKRIEKMKAKLTKTANGHGGIAAAGSETTPTNGRKATGLAKAARPKVPAAPKAPKPKTPVAPKAPKPKSPRGSKTAY